ncbi:MAG: 2-C-methyl-D-erythritol 2,4-cyclodiphosphate synthase [Chloroflexi bacterium]|nr:2-C-methyl-D-erythritol 2,4-cyclodiphosphate synthase [Chloroflexota bacterium]
MRVGLGYDVHPLVPGRPLVLGGVTIPHSLGLAGQSDGDVLTHAVIDAMLGAAALGDIGTHFPSADPQYSGISSLVLLARARDLLTVAGWRVGNLDATIVAEQPKMAPYALRMRQALGACLGVDVRSISVKATTTDRLGFVGRGEGIAAHAVVALEPVP